MFVWIDETGSDARNHIRKCGYALRDDTPACHRLLVRGQRTNVIAAISTRGLLTVELTTSKVNADVYCDFVSGSLIPQMMPFNGTNPCSIAVMDNLAVHHVEKVTDHFQQAGILVMYLPPYSPDLNPIEEAFSYVKKCLRHHDELLQVVPNSDAVIHSAFQSITTQHCKAWIAHSGYTSNH